MFNFHYRRCFASVCLSLTFLSIQADNIVPIDSFIHKDAVVSQGMFTTVKQDGHYFVSVAPEKMNRDILVTITITRGAQRKDRGQDMRFGYGGDSMYSRLIRLTRSKGNLQIILPENNTRDTTILNADYFKNIAAPIHKSLPIIAEQGDTCLVDITNMLMDDDLLFSLKGGANELKIGGPLTQFTSVVAINTFPENINFITNRTYTLNEPAKDEENISQWEVSSSWMMLPEKPMKPRMYDERVGYFPAGIYGLTTKKNNIDMGQVALHWRLEPKDNEIEKYKRGELVEPKKPIIYYISKSVPEYLRPYFIKAVGNWQNAFEQAGFKNAIHAEMVPEDSTYDEGDIRYPLISYKASPIPNAYGPNIADPRSGEIITTHIAVYHSVLDLIQRWYFVMCSQVDPRARQYPLDKDIIGKLVETVLTHEVGHTLGLRHNFFGSTCFPTDSLRSADFIKEHGLGSSIMDYQRYDYIVQPGDKVSGDELLPHIGNYDKFAIEWGYRYRPDETLEQTTSALRSWVTKKRTEGKEYMFLSETELGDPRVQSEDSGDDDITANTYGMKNLEYIMNHLEEWTQTPDNDYYPLRRRYLSIQNQYWNYIGHVMKYIAGHYCDRADKDEKGLNIYTTVPREQQERALKFLSDYLFKEPTWLWRASLMEKTNMDRKSYVDDPAHNKAGILFLKTGGMATMNDNNLGLDYKVLFDFLYNNIFGQYALSDKLSPYVRNLQRNILTDITICAENPYYYGIGVGTATKKLLEKIKAHAEDAARQTKDNITRAHHEAVVRFITIWQNDKLKIED